VGQLIRSTTQLRIIDLLAFTHNSDRRRYALRLRLNQFMHALVLLKLFVRAIKLFDYQLPLGRAQDIERSNYAVRLPDSAFDQLRKLRDESTDVRHVKVGLIEMEFEL